MICFFYFFFPYILILVIKMSLTSKQKVFFTTALMNKIKIVEKRI